jgi:ribosomal protein L40E
VLAEVEPEPIVAEVEPEPEPIVAEVEPEPEPMLAEVEPEPEPVEPPTRPRIAPISETILHFPTRAAPAPEPETHAAEPAAAEADTPEVAARRAQLDLLGLGDSGEGTVSDRPTVLPYRSRGATPTPGELAALARGGFWEASAREVAGAAANVGVQNCGQCGLSLSATARFCRRCGTRQAQPA